MKEPYGMTREEALALLEQNIYNANLRKHCLASEAVLRAMARHLNQDEEKWGLAGLLHDLDAESHPDTCRYIPIAALRCSAPGVYSLK